MAVSSYRSPVSSRFFLTKWLGPERLRKITTSSIAIFIVLGIWQLLCMGKDPALPPPLTVLTDTWGLIIDPFFNNGGTDVGLFWQILASLKRVAIGFSLAAITGIAVGILIGTSRLIYDALDPIFQVLRTVPPLAWLPISLAAFKDNEPSSIFVIFMTAIWPIVINTAVGVQQLPQDYKNVARVLKLSRADYFTNILLPATVPYVFTGLRIGIGLSWLAIVAAEMLVPGVGIGYFIWDSWTSSLISEIILALLYVGLVGLLLDKLVASIGRLLTPEEQK
ncbi:MAG: nitrate ABC transporter permease [Acaryochloris sp. RU_4_1]|nr:nitrate ABC transporter permease [Acaryochloris sp. SU_5_25]NJM65428.1 nitrate ABC transporter permease [Acaryochloris sp. RU_4_1]NJN37665.1 nitrate ABC transporter permease [Acaryochloridaceae cyanobacterium CSU_3_4]NJR54013.1 nitrate ABC transporter permease [Acaryochloris sp. CRU_2_0]